MTKINKSTTLSKKVLFIGNGVNNLNNGKSWDNLVADLRRTVGKHKDAEDLIKQFPLVFENLLNFGIKNRRINSEFELKKIVADRVTQIVPNQIHDRINIINPEHIITSNYDFALEEGYNVYNSSRISESRYSIFRRYKDDESGRNFWHVHGDCKNYETINLGYEHYSGQLQYLRNYVVSGSQYKSKEYHNLPLIKRLSNIPEYPDSWVDLLFTKEIHIIGLCLDFIEIDLWWLLTYRAKLIGQKGAKINNRIYYYIPTSFCESAKGKIELLDNMGIIVKPINKIDFEYYNAVLDMIIGKRTFSIKEILESN